jgi:hypothetical protein
MRIVQMELSQYITPAARIIRNLRPAIRWRIANPPRRKNVRVKNRVRRIAKIKEWIARGRLKPIATSWLSDFRKTHFPRINIG